MQSASLELWAHLLRTPQWYLLLIPLSVAAFHGCRNLEARGDFLFPCCGGMGILWKEGPAPEGHGRGEQLCWHSEKPYPGPNASCQNLTGGVQHEQCLASYFSPIIGNTVLLSPQGLSVSSATHVYFLFGPLLMCLCQQTCSLPAVVLSAEENTPCK